MESMACGWIQEMPGRGTGQSKVLIWLVMLEKIIADFSRAIDLLSGGITWIILGAVGGVAVEWETARAYHREMRVSDILASWVIGICFGAMTWVCAANSSEGIRMVYTVSSAMFGHGCGPLIKRNIKGIIENLGKK